MIHVSYIKLSQKAKKGMSWKKPDSLFYSSLSGSIVRPPLAGLDSFSRPIYGVTAHL